MEQVTGNQLIQKTISQLKEVGLFDFTADGSLSQKEQEECFAEALKGIEDIIIVEDGEVLDFDQFIKMPFNQAREQTERMSAKQRIEYLEKLDTRSLFLYNRTSLYTAGDGTPKDMQISHKEFISLLGKIKHCEILQNWLYGIY